MNPRQSCAVFTPTLNGGGAERAALNLCNGLVEQGVQVDLLMAKAQGQYLAELDPRIRQVELGGKGVLSALPALIRYLREKNPQFLLAVQTHSSLVALWARRLSGSRTRVLAWEHTTLSRGVRERQARFDRFLPGLARLFYPWADAVVAVSQGCADDLTEKVGIRPRRLHIIPNPIVTTRLFQLALAEPDRPELLEKDRQIILAVGRLTAAKDYPMLLRAFAELRKQRKAILMILGEGEERSALERLASELQLSSEVLMPGFVSNPFAYLARADVFALSSAWEGLPTVLVEAMACGVSVVATDCRSGPREILDGGRYGRLTPVGDAPSFAAGLLAALDQPGDLSAARERAMEYSAEVISRRYLELFAELAGHTPEE